MTAIRTERQLGERTVSERFATDRSIGNGHAVVNAVEGEIREFVRRDVSFRRHSKTETSDESTTENVNALIRQVSGASMEEIDRVILELQGVREMLRNEGERITRELAGFASLSHAAMTSMKIIADSVEQWKSPPQSRRQ